MRAFDLKVGMEVYVINHSVVGFKELKQVKLSMVDLERKFVEYKEYNDIAKREINVFAWIDDVVEINRHNKWLFAKAKTLCIYFNTTINSNNRVFDSIERLEPDVSPLFNFRKSNQ